MNKSRRDDSDAPGSQSLDKLNNFWIDLNEATAMRPEAKTQIYSVNKNLSADQVARMWGILDQLEWIVEKENSEAADTKVNCKEKIEFVDWPCDKSFHNKSEYIFIA